MRTIYDLWGSRSYTTGGYKSDVGVNGTWETKTGDPAISIKNINITGITGAYIELASPLSEDIRIEIFYGVNESYSNSNIKYTTLKAGETKILIGIPSGNWNSIRFDIGTKAGLKYKISHLGVLASDNQWNYDDIILELKGTVSISGIKSWQYTYTAGTNWNNYGNLEFSETLYVVYSAERNQNTYIRLCNNAGVCSSSTPKPIKIDKTVPKITSVRTIYDLWGSRSYTAGGYKSDVGVNGTWETTTADPTMSIANINITGLTGAYIELASPFSEDIIVEIYYAYNAAYSQSNVKVGIIKAGETKILIEIPSGSWNSIRFDIGTKAGLKYKISHLGVLATDSQANNDAIILETKGTVGISGIRSWQYTYTNGSNWTDVPRLPSLIDYEIHGSVRNQNAYIRLCNNAGVCSATASKLIHVVTIYNHNKE